MKEVGGEGKEGHACRQSPPFWKSAFASECSAWLARLVQQYWHVSIKDFFHTERSCMVSDTRFALDCKSIFFDLFWAKVALFYCHFLISCRVSFVLRSFYKGYSSFLCRGENCKTFCLAELWTCINMRRGSKYFTWMFVTFYPSNPTFWKFWAKTSKLHPCGRSF